MNTETLRPLRSNGPSALNEATARARMQEYINARTGRAVETLTAIQNVVPQDRVIPATDLRFEVVGSKEAEVLKFYRNTDANTGAGARPEGLHRNALSQLAGRLDIPMAYVDHLQGMADDGASARPWAKDLLARTLNEHVAHSEDRYLVRSVGGEARAVLSDKFRRIDCRPSALALLDAAKAKGLVVSDGSFTETRSTLKFILPRVIEVFPGEHMVFGFDWSNSDYGRGASDLRMFFFRLLCWNGAAGESVVRQIHIGKRLREDVDYAQETLEADARASALALRDAAAHALSDVKVDRMIEGIRAANAQKIDPKSRVETLRKTLTKGETEQVVAAFNSPDVEMMPAGNTLWRWSNAISFVAGQVEDADRRIDFERLAGDVMKPAMPAQAAA